MGTIRVLVTNGPRGEIPVNSHAEGAVGVTDRRPGSGALAADDHAETT
jgi:hypothetical protein